MATSADQLSEASRADYVARVNRVIDYIEANLQGDLRLDELARIACFSSYHFHRVFGAIVGETLGQFIQRLRVERAGMLLILRREMSVMEVALESGFASSATLARAFREAFGVTATQWRERADEAWCEEKRKIGKHVRKLGNAPGLGRRYLDPRTSRPTWRYEMTEEDHSMNATIDVQDLPDRYVAYRRHVGPYGQPGVVRRLFAELETWAGARELIDDDTEHLLVPHDNPHITEGAKLRLSVCITVPEGTTADGEVGTMILPGGKTAVGRFEIEPLQIARAWDVMIGDWLPQSGYQPDDRWCSERVVTSPIEHPEGKIVVDIRVPVRAL